MEVNPDNTAENNAFIENPLLTYNRITPAKSIPSSTPLVPAYSPAPSSSSTSPSPPPSSSSSSIPPKAERVSASTIRPSADFHKSLQPSLLSTEAPPQDFRGLYNLFGIILIAMNLRLVVENIIKYGWRINPSNWIRDTVEQWHSIWPAFLCAFFLIFITPVIAYYIEVFAMEKKINEKQADIINCIHVIIVFLLPQFLIVIADASVVSGLVLIFICLIITLKLISMAHVCHDIRLLQKKVAQRKKTDDKAPDANKERDEIKAIDPKLFAYQPSLSHIFYFLAAPTLCFQLEYPRTPKIRKSFVFRRLFEVLFCSVLQLFIVEQYIIPTVANAMPAFEAGDVLAIFERILKLAIPNTLVWLLMFYQLFHSWLNLTAELLRFGDRLFYKPWWNSLTLDIYWRNWNLPVHNWVVRHLYAPALRAGLSSLQAQFCAFLVSAILHEIMFSVPTHSLQYHAFLGMMMQVPLIIISRYLTNTLKKPAWGNSVFWISFCIFGQPLAVLLYAKEFAARNQIKLL